MSLSASLSNALSGLSAASRAAELVSSNISNALTPGYGPRSLQLSARAEGAAGGVRVDGVMRDVDPVLISDRRRADAALGRATAEADYLARLENVLGTPDDPGALSARVAELETALLAAAGEPAAPQRLDAAVMAAERLASGLRNASSEVQAMRVEADTDIGRMVERMNAALARVHDLNSAVVAAGVRGEDTSGLLDQRQRAIDDLAELVPLRELARPGGAVALYTQGGATLLDGSPVEIGFARSGVITANMTAADGDLSGLTVDGRPVPVDRFAGGRLESRFLVRDDLAVSAQAGLDALARELIARFEDGLPDPTLAPGAPGLFTDAGAAFAAGAETGLAGRVEVNDAVRPETGGASWRLRDGLGAATPGPAGDGALLTAMQTAVAEARPPVAGGFGSVPRGVAALAADLAAQVSTRLVDAEARQSHAAAQHTEIALAERRLGVDTDSEMQRLMVIEQLYGANARMIRAIDEMMDTLTRL
ncbi:flagellar hook-associated protein FlgK [Rhodosalinus halophilus]|uniref:Flagellar hook-associated protein 1 n=1 Tax=Rhodosalinus halophilus TaxID=2259333 RepID=A0A365U7F2_9RHOB|nr:flagellar hook-associated protein FlgK [Rhodosalinus halophilus]